jgi:hypothetical protein
MFNLLFANMLVLASVKWDVEGIIFTILFLVVGPAILIRGLSGLANGEAGWIIAAAVVAAIYFFLFVAAPSAFVLCLICMGALPLVFFGLGADQVKRWFE